MLAAAVCDDLGAGSAVATAAVPPSTAAEMCLGTTAQCTLGGVADAMVTAAGPLGEAIVRAVEETAFLRVGAMHARLGLLYGVPYLVAYALFVLVDALRMQWLRRWYERQRAEASRVLEHLQRLMDRPLLVPPTLEDLKRQVRKRLKWMGDGKASWDRMRCPASCAQGCHRRGYTNDGEANEAVRQRDAPRIQRSH